MPPIKKKSAGAVEPPKFKQKKAKTRLTREQRDIRADQLADLLDDDMPGFNMTGGSNLSGRGKSRLNKKKPMYIAYSKPSLPSKARLYFNTEKA
ncbi:hypothetical protein GX50_04577 [[Emmonsia] crescens]|uniref:Uncharacterized protein n=1 Tax=[Emmonsia] crescens TaxID=73230 RepID=A0A2B7ZHF8_9EURO|nr:hypothetical protein GX50_04577 [Emmonsia crescens]